MSSHQPFRYATEEALLKEAERLNLTLPWSDRVDPLLAPTTIDTSPLPNRFAVQPMEGFDGTRDGRPGELTFRRYDRYARGGSGLIWFEATSVTHEGKSNPHQLTITPETFPDFQALVRKTRHTARSVWGSKHRPFLVLQLTHSGRYSRSGGSASPQAADRNPCLDDPNTPPRILKDTALEQLEESYINAAELAHRAGFDGVDIKACHGYLVNNLLAAHTRKASRYGGPMRNRFRFLLSVVGRIKTHLPDLRIAVRLNAADGTPHPYGFGMAEDGTQTEDLSEPQKLVRLLADKGCVLLNITAGNPVRIPHWTRPFDRPAAGTETPQEHPLEGVLRLIRLSAEIQETVPDIPLVGTGYSWLRQYAANVGAGTLLRKGAHFIGFGRNSFAYPDAPRDLIENGKFDSQKVCTTCSRCTERMRRGEPAGCVMRDGEIYGQ